MIAKHLLQLMGWKLQNKVQNHPKKAIIIGGPHTSNWDAFYLFLVNRALNLKMVILVKHTFFKWPLKYFLLKFGAYPINRNSKQGYVAKMTEEFNNRSEMLLAMSPEGTRSYKPYWKTGFLNIAYASKVPIFMAAIDYPTKTITFGEQLQLSHNIDKDMLAAKQYILANRGKHPKHQLSI